MAPARKGRSPLVWLVLAAVLLGVGAWLMRGAEPPEREKHGPVNLPNRMTRTEERKNAERRTLLVPTVEDAGLVQEPSRPKDPVLALMPSSVKRGAVVGEYNAIINSELGPKLTQCLFGDGDDKFLRDLRDAGVDPVNGIDRVAMIDDNVVITGDFKNVKWKELVRPDTVKDYGPHAQLFETTKWDGGTETLGVWNGQMFIAGGDEASIKATLDRLEGRGITGPPVLDDSMAYGEVYGVMNAAPVAAMLRKSEPKLADLILQSAKSMQVHMDVGHDVGMVADVTPGDPAMSEELRRTLGGALSLARMQAAAKGDNDTAGILDLARVQAAGGAGAFRLEAGLPHDFMKKALDECIEERRRGFQRRDAGE
jgi:hypothetical protein